MCSANEDKTMSRARICRVLVDCGIVAAIVCVVVLLVWRLGRPSTSVCDEARESFLSEKQKAAIVLDAIERAEKRVRTLRGAGKHRDAAILLNDIAAIERMLTSPKGSDEEPRKLSEPSAFERLARLEFVVAGLQDEYSRHLKLRYPTWKEFRGHTTNY